MDAALPLEQSVGALGEGRVAGATRRLARRARDEVSAFLDQFELESLDLGKALVHPGKIAGPDLGFVSACPGTKLDDGWTAVLLGIRRGLEGG